MTPMDGTTVGSVRPARRGRLVPLLIGLTAGTAITVRFTTPVGTHVDRTAMTVVSNNPYVFSGPPDYGRRLRLDSGVLGISTAAEGTSVDGGTGAGIRHWEADHLRLESDRPILAGLDGEALTFDSPLKLVSRPRGLRVLVPAGTKPGYVPPREMLAAELVGLARFAGVPGTDEDDPRG